MRRRYEFCAPQYLDFGTLIDEQYCADDADEWFETVATQGARSHCRCRSCRALTLPAPCDSLALRRPPATTHPVKVKVKRQRPPVPPPCLACVVGNS